MCIHQLFRPKPFSPRSFSIFGAEGSWDLMHAHVSIFLADFFSFSHCDVNVVPCRLRLGLCSLDILFCLGLRSACGEADDGIVASQHSMLTAGFCRWLAGSHSRQPLAAHARAYSLVI